MRYVKSLRELRREVNLELRNIEAPLRYSDEEVNNAIRRAVQLLEPYFWYETSDTTKTVVNGTFDYVYTGRCDPIWKVTLTSGSMPPRIIYDWDFSVDPVANTTTLSLFKNHTAGATITVWFEIHPVQPPSDLSLAEAVAPAYTSFDVNKTNTDLLLSAYNWPLTGYAELTRVPAAGYGKEFISYTLDIDGAVDPLDCLFTVTRSQLGTTAETVFATGDVVSYVLISDSSAFFEGVKELAISNLNRMRLTDAPSADTSGQVTVMREINENFDNWLRRNKMRSKRPSRGLLNRTIPMPRRRWWRTF